MVRQRNLLPIGSLPNGPTARVGQDQNQESGSSSGSPKRVAGTQVVGPSFTVFPGASKSVALAR